MLLSDREIRRLCIHDGKLLKQPMLAPFSECVQGGGVISYGLTSAGYDLRLSSTLLVFKNTYNEIIDPKRFKDDDYKRRVFDEVCKPAGDSFVLPPHSYALGMSLEYIRVPRSLKGRCVGKSTLARCGILINTTPLEPGWHGHLTIEISNITPCPALVFSGEGIAQLEFELMTEEPEIDYGMKDGKYQGQTEVTPARVK